MTDADMSAITISDKIKQPEWKGKELLHEDRVRANAVTRQPIKFIRGQKRSIKRLEELGFDPIQEMVNTYDKLLGELEYQEGMRMGTVVEVRGDGKARAYRAEIHHALYDRLTNIAEKLVRYGYGRVPEGIVVDPSTIPPLRIELTDKTAIIVNEVPDMPVIEE
jgi:hypothetical protein